MKPATVPCRGSLSHILSILAPIACAFSLLGSGSATAESVDSELLLLVDVSNGGLKKGEFDRLMNSYADALSSDAVLASIASGATGKIAVSLSFYGVEDSGSSRAVHWMAISNRVEAEAFASKLRSLTEPKGGKYSYQAALVEGLTSIGDEVGGIDNGFSSALQIIEVGGSTRPKDHAGDVAAASAAALGQGVDLINATVLGKNADKLESFYAENVIGGSLGNLAASVRASEIDGGLSAMLTSQMSQTLGSARVSTVPEPTSAMLLVSSLGFLLIFARRRPA